MDRIRKYQVFTAVADLLSFTKAADSLNLPNATISTTIKALEEQLGVELFNRTTRQVSLTREGSVFLEKCLHIINEVELAETMFQSSSHQLKGKIRVDMAVNFAREIVLPRLGDFYAHYPEIEIELSSTDSFIDLTREGIDLVIRSGMYSNKNLIIEKLIDVSYGNFISPGYAKRYGVPGKVSELKNHFIVSYVQRFEKLNQSFSYVKDGKNHLIKMQSVIAVNNTVSYTEACLAGLGIAQLPVLSVKKYLRQKQLIEILPEYCLADTRLDIVYPDNKRIPERIKVFVVWIESVLSSLK